MRQKVALTAAHLMAEGTVADAGMGSGGGSIALANLYPELQVVGVDLDPEMVRLAAAKYQAPNLRFVVGDVGGKFAAPGSLDAIFDSSVLHHVSSFTGYSSDAVRVALREQCALLKPHGVLLVRDFVGADKTDVLLDLPDDDGDHTDDARTCSTAALLRKFSREFRALHDNPGFALREIHDAAGIREGWRRFVLSRQLAAEFVLRKDYRADWDAEVKEEYCYFTQEEFEAEFRKLGMRLLASTPLHNPWIVKHRYDGKYELRTLQMQSLPHHPTNYLIVGERVGQGEGVGFCEEPFVGESGFLEPMSFEGPGGRVVDLLRRPNDTLDVIPYFESARDVYVVVRAGYPRPILGAAQRTRTLDGGAIPQYITEPLTFVRGDGPRALEIERFLQARANIDPSHIAGFRSGSSYYPSPGGVLELAHSQFVELKERQLSAKLDPLAGGFATGGRLHAIAAEQVLRSTQVGGMPDVRVELNVYDLLSRLDRPLGPWIGAEIGGGFQHEPPPNVVDFSALRLLAPRRVFAPRSPSTLPFMQRLVSSFAEVDAAESVVGACQLEYAVPRAHSLSSVALAVLWRTPDDAWLGVVDDDRATAQSFTGHSNLLTTPAWRLPTSVLNLAEAERFARQRLLVEFGVATDDLVPLGGTYFPTPGLTPESVHPFVAPARSCGPDSSLLWIRVAELAQHATALRDTHLRVAVLRLAHALSLH